MAKIYQANLEFNAGTDIKEACGDMYQFLCENKSKVVCIFNGVRITMEDNDWYERFNKPKLSRGNDR